MGEGLTDGNTEEQDQLLDTLVFPYFPKRLGVRLFRADLVQFPFSPAIEGKHEHLGSEIDEQRVRREGDPRSGRANDHRLDGVRADLGVRAVHLVCLGVSLCAMRVGEAITDH